MSKYRLYVWMGVIGVSCLMPLSFVYAQCIAGLPCVVEHSTGANASKSDSGACDADFMNQIYARAFIESEREVVVAQQNVSKPDSVLAFSCFDVMAKDALETYNPIFSANTDTPGDIPEGEFYQDTFLDLIKEYIDTSFLREYFTNESGIDYQVEQSPCDVLMSVQFLSRCANVDTVGDLFYDFEALADVDPRIMPAGGACPGTAIDSELISVAENIGDTYASFDVFEEEYVEQVSGDTCTDPVGTGLFYEAPLEISWTSLGEYLFGDIQVFEHKVCVNPSCYYNIRDDECVAK